MSHVISCKDCGEVKEQIIYCEANTLPFMWCLDLKDVWRKHAYLVAIDPPNEDTSLLAFK